MKYIVWNQLQNSESLKHILMKNIFIILGTYLN